MQVVFLLHQWNWETDHDGSFKNLWSHSGNNETVWSLPNKPTGAIINAVEAAQPGPAIQEMQIPLDDADATVHRLYAFEIPETPRHRAREVPLVDPPNRVADAEIGLKGPGVEENWSKGGKIPWKLTSEAQGAIPITMKSAESLHVRVAPTNATLEIHQVSMRGAAAKAHLRRKP